MGNLKMADRNENCPFFTGFRRPEEVKNIVYYISRSKDKNNKNDLILWGALGMMAGITAGDVVKIILTSQSFYRDEKNIGPRIFHEIFWLTPEDAASIYQYRQWKYCLNMLAQMAAHVYYSQGYQVVYAVHESGPGKKHKFHIHFAVNTVNIYTGEKFHTNLNEDQRIREAYMNKYLIEVLKWAYLHGNLRC